MVITPSARAKGEARGAARGASSAQLAVAASKAARAARGPRRLRRARATTLRLGHACTRLDKERGLLVLPEARVSDCSQNLKNTIRFVSEARRLRSRKMGSVSP